MSKNLSKRVWTNNIAYTTEVGDDVEESLSEAAERAVTQIESTGMGVASYEIETSYDGLVEVTIDFIPRKNVDHTLANDMLNRVLREMDEAGDIFGGGASP